MTGVTPKSCNAGVACSFISDLTSAKRDPPRPQALGGGDASIFIGRALSIVRISLLIRLWSMSSVSLESLKDTASKILRKVPGLGDAYRRDQFRRRWDTELRVLDGEDLSESTHPSILHVSLNRSATQWVKSVLHRCAVPEGLAHVRWNEMAFNSGYPYLDKLEDVGKYDQIFHPKGYLYSAFGGYPKGIPHIEQYKVVLAIRDPRDILVSRYFSKKISHPTPPEESDKREKFLEDRAYAQEASIDDFVMDKSDDLLDRYECYINKLLEEHPDVHVARYEDMVADVEEWLNDLLEYIEISPSEDARMEIVEEAHSIQSGAEDPSAHNRKGETGDHAEKLRSSTIKQLNDKFRHVLNRFNYDH